MAGRPPCATLTLEITNVDIVVETFGTLKTKAIALEKLKAMQAEKGGLLYFTYKSKI